VAPTPPHKCATERITDTVQSTRFNYQLSIINTDRYTDVRLLLKGTLLVRDIYVTAYDQNRPVSRLAGQSADWA
jgi:hypothetical protein